MASHGADGTVKQTQVEIDLNWKQLVNKEFRQAGQWDSLWSNVFWDKDIPDSQADRSKETRRRIEELEARLRQNREETGEVAGMRSSQRTNHRGQPSLEQFDLGKNAYRSQGDLMAAFTSTFRWS